jgi:polysaccharide biosynthesis/export protein VpsN
MSRNLNRFWTRPFVALLSPTISLFLFLMAQLGMLAHAANDVAQTYRLSAGDSFKVYVVGEDDLTKELTINTEGAVYFPLLGRLQVTGMTDSELENLFRERLTGDYLVNPDVSVLITQYREVFLEGQVREPGPYQFSPGMTVRQAIAKAGGFTDYANRKKIYRHSKDNPGADKERVSQSDSVLPGDVIEVAESWF